MSLPRTKTFHSIMTYRPRDRHKLKPPSISTSHYDIYDIEERVSPNPAFSVHKALTFI